MNLSPASEVGISPRFKKLDEDLYGYNQLIASFGYETLVEESDSDYQGDTLMLFKHGDNFGYLNFDWGSCSGCDAYEAVQGNVEEEMALRDSLWESIRWGNREEMIEFLQKHDWKGDYVGEDLVQQFLDKALPVMKGLPEKTQTLSKRVVEIDNGKRKRRNGS